MPLELPQPYLLLLADVTDTCPAKTAFGLRDWAPERCVGEWALPAATVTVDLPGCPRPAPGQLYRRTPTGELKLVASGWRRPPGVPFVEQWLWVSDVNGDFIAGIRRELPDGFVVEIIPAP